MGGKLRQGLRGTVATVASVLALAAPAAAEHSVIEQMSVGSGSGPASLDSNLGISRVSVDGSSVVFPTFLSYSPADTDDRRDLYLSQNGTMTLLSAGPAGGNGPHNVSIRVNGSSYMTPDLSKVLFSTAEALVADDTNGVSDLYQWSSGTVTRIGPDVGVAQPVRISDDGARVFFHSVAQLVPEDTDSVTDLYEHSSGATKLVSGSGVLVGISKPDGDRVLFETTEALVPEDTNGTTDVYERSGGTTTLRTPGTNGVFLRAMSDDASKIFFESDAALVPADTDSETDIYTITGGAPELVSTGPNDQSQCAVAVTGVGVSGDGTRAYFQSSEALVPEDTDACGVDLYLRSGGVTTLISTGAADPEDAVADFRGEFDGGQRVLYSRGQIYERAGTTTTKLTPGTEPVNFRGASADGERIFFSSHEQLLPSDTDGTVLDLYEVHAGSVTHITAGPASVPDTPVIDVQVAPTGDPFFTTLQRFGADADDATDVFAARLASGTYARPKGATPFQVYLVPAYQACTSPNRTHGPPLAFGSCAPPAQASPHLTVGTADANAQPAKSIASVRLDTLPGNPATPADEADVQITVTESDVRERPGLGDYTGELQLELGLRTTDRDGALPSGGGPAAVTSADAPLSVTVPCQATTDTTVGASCNLTTTADSVVPGAVVERGRAIWALGQVRVFDGGPDGDVQTADNALFQVQGVFIP